jgi:hypothetical protein
MKAPDLFLQKKGGKSFSLDWNNRSLAKKIKRGLGQTRPNWIKSGRLGGHFIHYKLLLLLLLNKL